MAKAEIKQRVPIFVSSTYEDLIPYREEVQRVLMRLEQMIKGMEYFGSNSKRPLDVCLQNVRDSKVFIGIIGMRYGSVEEESGKSFTQLEYEEAIKNKIPVLIYIINEEFPISPKFVDIDKKAKLLLEFKKLLTKNHFISYFTTPNDLGKKVTTDLLELLKSLDQIDVNNEDKINIKEDFEEILKKFILRPAKYKAQEGVLTIKISNRKKAYNIKGNVIASLGMTLGDTIYVPVYVINKQTLEPITDRPLNLYGEKEMADWIEQVSPETIVTVKLRLEFIVTKEIEPYDDGSILKDITYNALVLLEVLP